MAQKFSFPAPRKPVIAHVFSQVHKNAHQSFCFATESQRSEFEMSFGVASVWNYFYLCCQSQFTLCFPVKFIFHPFTSAFKGDGEAEKVTFVTNRENSLFNSAYANVSLEYIYINTHTHTRH